MISYVRTTRTAYTDRRRARAGRTTAHEHLHMTAPVVRPAAAMPDLATALAGAWTKTPASALSRVLAVDNTEAVRLSSGSLVFDGVAV
jgi:hypothetical protein